MPKVEVGVQQSVYPYSVPLISVVVDTQLVFIVVRVAVQERDLVRVGSAGKTAQAPYAPQAPYTFSPSVTLAVQQFISS